jgi:RND family efflux transporter MFP subunit
MSPAGKWSGWILAAGGALLVASCDRSGASGSRARAAVAPREVRLAVVAVRPMERVVTVSGTLAAQEESTLSSKVSGRLQSIAVDVGSQVRQGDTLAQVEPRDYELRLQQAAAAVAQARAELGLPLEGENDQLDVDAIALVRQARAMLGEAGKNRDRIHQLSEDGIATAAELDSVEAAHVVARTRYEAAVEEARTRLAALAQRRVELEIARKQLADAIVRAPFDGVIQARVAGLGQYVAPGTPIVTLVRMDPLRLRLEVPERESVVLRPQQPVRLRVEGDPRVYGGTLTRLSPALGEATRTLRVEADVPLQGTLRPGLFARVQIVVDPEAPGVAVPTNSLLNFAGLEKVVTVQDAKALERVVTTGRRGPDWIEVVEGLSAGEAVILDPTGLRTGQPVTTNAPAPPPDRTESRPPAAGPGAPQHAKAG